MKNGRSATRDRLGQPVLDGMKKVGNPGRPVVPAADTP
jgi:hypothetical protein